MAESKQILVQLWINCFKSRKLRGQKSCKKLKERIDIYILLTVGVFLCTKKISYCQALRNTHLKTYAKDYTYQLSDNLKWYFNWHVSLSVRLSVLYRTVALYTKIQSNFNDGAKKHPRSGYSLIKLYFTRKFLLRPSRMAKEDNTVEREKFGGGQNYGYKKDRQTWKLK